jgi:hypothetical protein
MKGGAARAVVSRYTIAIDSVFYFSHDLKKKLEWVEEGR